MSLGNAPFDSTSGFQKFYDSFECSDVEIVVPGRVKNILAHKVVLAAGSEVFRRKIQEIEPTGLATAFLELKDILGDEAVETAIKHLYGIPVLGKSGSPSPKPLIHLANIGIFAERYEIPGLVDAVFEAATRSLLDCLDDEGELDMLFCLNARNIPRGSKGASAFFRFATKVFGDNIEKLRNRAAFQRLLVGSPRLGVDILKYVVEKQSKVKNRQWRLEVSE